MMKVVFVDRDGTIVREPRDEQIDTLEKLEFVPGIVSGLKLLADYGYTLVMVSNQDGLGSNRYPRRAYAAVQKKIIGLLGGEGIRFEKVFICPHRTDEHCKCRKPQLGLVRGFLKTHRFDRERSFVFGDRESDVQFAVNLGVKSVRLTKHISSRATYKTTDIVDACRFILWSNRLGTIRRKTSETDVFVRVAVDGTGEYNIHSGIGFFDHMLEQLARHSKMDVVVKASGDLQVDEHHTIEDVGIALGEALRIALGQKRGIERFSAPMDESLASVFLDLSGRSHLTYKCSFNRERVGDLPTELVEDFFRAFVQGLKATLHISCSGRNDHHKIEAMFKSVARALKSAAAIDMRSRNSVPSTKGIL